MTATEPILGESARKRNNSGVRCLTFAGEDCSIARRVEGGVGFGGAVRRVSKRLRADAHCTCGRTPYAPNEVAIRVAHEADRQGVADARRLERFRRAALPHRALEAAGPDQLGYGIPEWLRLVPVDFEAGDAWWERLAEAGFKKSSTYRRPLFPGAISRAGQMGCARQIIRRNCWWRIHKEIYLYTERRFPCPLHRNRKPGPVRSRAS